MTIKGILNHTNMNNFGIIDTNRRAPNIRRTTQVEGDRNFQEVEKHEEYLEEDIIKAIETVNKEFIVYDRRFEFSIHDKTKQIIVKVIDATNDEIIREIPPEKILDMVARMWEIAGIIVDERI